MLGWLEDFTAGLIVKIKEYIAAAFSPLYEWFAENVLGTAAGFVPEWITSAWTNTTYWLEVINVWFPVSEFLVGYGAYLSAWGVFVGVKTIAKCIPTVG